MRERIVSLVQQSLGAFFFDFGVVCIAHLDARDVEAWRDGDALLGGGWEMKTRRGRDGEEEKTASTGIDRLDLPSFSHANTYRTTSRSHQRNQGL